MYEYPRGGTKVTGPSIRLAEAMAQNWGNLDYGLIELEQKAGESQVMAYAWDLETNTRQTIVFSVPHIRATKREMFRSPIHAISMRWWQTREHAECVPASSE